MKSVTILFILFLFPVTAFSAVILVPEHYSTIQGAINNANENDTILVAPGTYVENLTFVGVNIEVRSDVDRKASTPDICPEDAVIDGNQNSWSVVSIENGEGRDTILEGFTIRNGEGKWIVNPHIWYGYGAGIYCSDSSPTIKNNIICSNTLPQGGAANNFAYGAGIYCKTSSPAIVNNILYDNVAYQSSATGCGYGGAIYIEGKDDSQGYAPEITGNIIGNSDEEYTNGASHGGGIYCCDMSFLDPGMPGLKISNNIIFKNIAYYGGGICCKDIVSDSGCPYPVIINDTLCGNMAHISGGGIYFTGISSYLNPLRITNTILWQNESGEGAELSLYDNSYIYISFSDLAAFPFSVFEEPGSMLVLGPGNISAVPLFVDPDNDDYHLTFPSPCKDTGDTGAVLDPEDFEGDPRVAYGTVDMGADEFYTHFYITGDKTPGGVIQAKWVGLPGTTPVYLILGSGVRWNPLDTPYGKLYLLPPLYFFGPMPPIPPSGVLVIEEDIPSTIPAPYDLPMQGLIGMNSDSLTNLYILKVR